MSLVSQLTLLQEAMGYMELQSLNQLQFARRVRNISDLGEVYFGPFGGQI